MPSRERRSLLATLGTVAVSSVAGCASLWSNRPPAGSLRFVNEHSVPHSISMRVTGVGSSPGDGPGEVEGDPIVPPTQRRLSASAVAKPGETQTYEGVFTEPAWYAVQFTLDGKKPGNNSGVVVWSPASIDGGSWEFLTGKVYNSGEFSWVVSSTQHSGSFGE